MRLTFLQTSDPPHYRVNREYAGGMGVFVGLPTPGTAATTAFPNLQLAFAAGVGERDGHEVTFVDAQAEQLDGHAAAARVASTGPDFVVGLVSLPSIESDLAALAEVKAAAPDAAVLAAGAVCSALTDRIAKAPGIDYVAVGEPEAIAPELWRALDAGIPVTEVAGLAYRSGDLVARTAPAMPIADLDTLPNVPYHLLPLESYRADLLGDDGMCIPVQTSKGCPFKCGYYCPYPAIVGKKVRMRSPERVIEELRYLHDHGVRKVVFRDQIFTYSMEHATELCTRMIEEDLGMRWVCETRFDRARDHDVIQLMRDAGCEQINFGLESGSPELFEASGKPGTDFGTVGAVIDDVRSTGIQAHVHIIIGVPGESWKTVRETAHTVKQFTVDSVQLSNMIAYPGTKFFEDAKAKGLILTEDPAAYGGDHIPVRTEAMSATELLLARIYLRKHLWGQGYVSQAVPITRAVGRRVAGKLDGLRRRRETEAPPVVATDESGLSGT